MNLGWAVLGVSAAAAVVASVGFGVATDSARPIQVPSIGVCGSPQPPDQHFRTMAASFVIKNSSRAPVRILGLRATHLAGLASAPVTIHDGADREWRRDFRVGAAVSLTEAEVESSSAVFLEHPVTMKAGSFATVIANMTLADGASAGQASAFELVTEGPLGSIRTQTIDAAVGLGVSSTACSAALH